MRIAFFGDVVGKSGREAVCRYILKNKRNHRFDCVVVNGENAAHGFGITQSICEQFFTSGVDVITLGNHTFDQKSDLQMFDRDERLIRPMNYPSGSPGHGYSIIDIPFVGKKVLVISLIGRLFMELNDDPFRTVSSFLSKYALGVSVDGILIDFHAEATAEKMALAKYLDGRVSCVIGTHTHIPTADAQIFSNGTGFLSDCGMCGDYNSVIGMDEEAAIGRFTSKIHAFAKLQPAVKEATVCGVVIDVNDKGLCTDMQTIRVGGSLIEQKDCSR
jgi:metallophosphoesterase (TIGR00282 family)